MIPKQLYAAPERATTPSRKDSLPATISATVVIIPATRLPAGIPAPVRQAKLATPSAPRLNATK